MKQNLQRPLNEGNRNQKTKTWRMLMREQSGWAYDLKD